MEDTHHAPRWKTLLAFGIIYFVWGSTFLAIRIGVHEVPPLLFAAMRFTTAGVLVYLWAAAKKELQPTARQWLSVLVLAFLIFVVDYGFLFWAEQRVPSGIAAVILATIPAFMALSEIIILRTQRLTPRLSVALLAGIAGVAVLMSPSIGKLGGTPIDTAGAVGLIIGAIGWSIASALARKLPLPSSKVMSSGAQMLAGGAMLAAVSAARGEWRGFNLSAVSGPSLDRACLPDSCRLHRRIHSLRVAAASRIANQSWNLCVRQPRRGCNHRLFSRRRTSGRAHRAGRSVCPGQRRHHHQHAHQNSRRSGRRGMKKSVRATAPQAKRKFTP